MERARTKMSSFAFFWAGLCSCNVREMEFGERSYILSLFDPVRRSLSDPRLHSCLSFRMQLSPPAVKLLSEYKRRWISFLGGASHLLGKPPLAAAEERRRGGNFACQATHNYLQQGRGSETFSYPVFFCNRSILCSKSTPSVDPPQLSGVYKRPFSLAPPPTVSSTPFERKPLFKEKRWGKKRSVGLAMASSDPLLLLGVLLVLAAAASEAEAAEDGRGRGGEGGRGGRGGPFGGRKPKICE